MTSATPFEFPFRSISALLQNAARAGSTSGSAMSSVFAWRNPGLPATAGQQEIQGLAIFAMNAMAQLYLDEDGEYHHPERGLRYLCESAARGDIYNALGLVYWRGRGGQEADLGRAFDFFTDAAAGGHPTAPCNLARMYRDGQASGGTDVARAVEWFEVALERSHAACVAQAGWLLRSQSPAGYDRYDAASIAAGGTILLNSSGAASAQEQLTHLAEGELAGDLQRLLAAMERPVDVNGVLDDATLAALAMLLAETARPRQPIRRSASFWQRAPIGERRRSG